MSSDCFKSGSSDCHSPIKMRLRSQRLKIVTPSEQSSVSWWPLQSPSCMVQIQIYSCAIRLVWQDVTVLQGIISDSYIFIYPLICVFQMTFQSNKLTQSCLQCSFVFMVWVLLPYRLSKSCIYTKINRSTLTTHRLLPFN